MIPFDDIQAAAVPYVMPLVHRWLGSKYKTVGGWLVGPSPFRTDKNYSFGVSLATGIARDFATGDRWDLIALYAAVYHVPMAEAAACVARAVGHPYAETPHRSVSR